MSYQSIMDLAGSVVDAAKRAQVREIHLLQHSAAAAAENVNADRPCSPGGDLPGFCDIDSIPDLFEWLPVLQLGGSGTHEALTSASRLLSEKATASMGPNEAKLDLRRRINPELFNGTTASAFGGRLSNAAGAASNQFHGIRYLLHADHMMTRILNRAEKNLEQIARKTIHALNAIPDSDYSADLKLVSIAASAAGGATGAVAAGVGALEFASGNASDDEAGTISGAWVDQVIASMADAINAQKDGISKSQLAIKAYLDKEIEYVSGHPREFRVKDIVRS